MKVLVIGPGAREHALVSALSRDPQVEAVIAAPGNPGIDLLCDTRPLDQTDPAAAVDLAQELDVDLVVVGPEAPLVAGVSDALREASFPVFGPGQEAATLEGSKTYAKEVMEAAGVPTAQAVAATTSAEAAEALDRFGAPYVVKADGLAAGKGVVVTDDRSAALSHAESCLAVADRVVIEAYLDGPEVSLFVVCDGTTAVPLSPAQDFKRIGDGDTGPNTGGMGAYSPLPWAPEGMVDDVVARVAQPVVDEMARRGSPFVGLLYCGLALTSQGMRVIEFNVRFGDPETQSVLARLRTPLAGLLLAAAQGTLAQHPPLEWDERTAITVVLAAQNYPGAPRTGDPIAGLEEALALDGVDVFHAGTALGEQGEFITSGGRVLSVVGLGDGIAAARSRAYAAADLIDWEGVQKRTDIALLAAEDAITVPEAALGTAATAGPARVPSNPTAAEAAAGSQPAAPAVPGWTHAYSGKVRDLYIREGVGSLETAEEILMVASDRISAYDWVLPTEIPDKGKVLTGLTLWWFDQLADLVGNHVVSVDVPDVVAGRAMICTRLEMFPVECVARGHLTGSGLADYRAAGTVGGNALPEGLGESSPLEPAIYTPATKAAVGEHDENIDFDRTAEMLGAVDAAILRDLTLEVFERARTIAAERGIVLADTKFEFGRDANGAVVLGDEALTPDSSRFWDAESFVPGQPQDSFDKQFVRDWLTSEDSGWDRSGDTPPPPLPAAVVERTRQRYIDAFARLTGQQFPG
ncbi:MAG: phosphoribosylamine--glycine ligase [Brevibacterium yomogidense]